MAARVGDARNAGSSSRLAATSTATSGSTRDSSSSSSALAATRRAHSFLGSDDRIVLDIGARVIKAGYSGEAQPRVIVSSVAQATPPEGKGEAMGAVSDDLLWSIDICRCKDESEYRRALYALKGRLTFLLRKTLYNSLAADPKQRKVVVIENAFMPNVVKRTLTDVLYGNLQVAAVSFVPSHLMSAVAIGRMDSVVVDIGEEQTTLLPIYLWRPLAPRFLSTTTRAARRLSARLKALLIHFATFIASPSTVTNTSTSSPPPAMRRKEKVGAHLLSPDVLETIKAKALIIGDPIDTESGLPSPSLGPGQPNGAWQSMPSFSTMDEEDDEMYMEALRQRYQPHTTVKDMVIQIPALQNPTISPQSQPSTIGARSVAHNSSPGMVIVPGWIRERAADVLFERGDPDEPSILELILDNLVKLPVDIRTALARNVYLTGGSAMLPGLAHRVRLELMRMLDRSARECENVTMPDLALTLPRVGARSLHATNLPTSGKQIISMTSKTAAKASTETDEASRIGDDTFVSALGENDTFQSTASADTPARVSRGGNRSPKTLAGTRPFAIDALSHRYRPIAQLAPYVAVLNDHAPRLDAEGAAIGGHAPSFAPNIASWIGASLLGSMRIESLDLSTREAWEATRDAPSSPTKGASSTRPPLGLGRGSFLGTVGGLDLGSYGPLSAGAHGAFTGAQSRAHTER